jgi:enoyl-CoA hydratase/carnithine racemase
MLTDVTMGVQRAVSSPMNLAKTSAPGSDGPDAEFGKAFGKGRIGLRSGDRRLQFVEDWCRRVRGGQESVPHFSAHARKTGFFHCHQVRQQRRAFGRCDGESTDRAAVHLRLQDRDVAAVNGWAMGGGFWYQLAADITIASDRAVFAQPEVRHGSNSSFLFAALCGWKAANRWTLTGDHFDAQEALRIGMVNEVVPHEKLMDTVYALARRMALVPEPALRLNKAITMLGIQASGLHAGLLVEGALSAMAHASHNEEREKLFAIQRAQGMKAYLDERDGPFQPEPMGPRSAKARSKKTAAKNITAKKR